MGNDKLWNGWPIAIIPASSGGVEKRTRQRLQSRHRLHVEVLTVLRRTEVGRQLYRGDPGVEVPLDLIEQWEQAISGNNESSSADDRIRTNFLARGLIAGQKKLGWKVEGAPRLVNLLPIERPPFTHMEFAQLEDFRHFCTLVEHAIRSSEFNRILQYGNGKSGHLGLTPELISWGLIIFYAVTRNGLLDSKDLTILPLYTQTLACYKQHAWLFLYSHPIDRMPGKEFPPMKRWLMRIDTLSILLRHIECHQHPSHHIDTYHKSKEYTERAWRHFCRAVGLPTFRLSRFLSSAQTDHGLRLPPFLTGGMKGRFKSTSLREERWQQLLLSGYMLQESSRESEVIPWNKSVDKKETFQLEAPNLTQPSIDKTLPPREAHDLLEQLKSVIVKRRGDKRLSFSEMTRKMEFFVRESSQMAPIAHSICRWLLALHLKKRAMNTLRNYLGITRQLLGIMGNTEVDEKHLLQLQNAYQAVIEKSRTVKNRSYKWTVLHTFHLFLMQYCKLPNVEMDVSEDFMIARSADANCLSETEYKLIADYLHTNINLYMGEDKYWLFVLGYRTGLRISEALSIRLDDLLFDSSPHSVDRELILYIRDNPYNKLKSFNAKRQLRLHLLLGEDEFVRFRDFICTRVAIHKGKYSAFLFGEGMAPINDEEIRPDIHRAMRNITGDQSLRYHHLRHSLANYLLLSYFEIDVPWESPPHLSKLWQEIAHTSRRTGLYYIAQSTGHASPEETLRSYLHFNDLLAQHFLSHTHPTVEDKGALSPYHQLLILKEVLDITPTRLRQWSSRFSDQPMEWLKRRFPLLSKVDISARNLPDYPAPSSLGSPPQQRLNQVWLSELEAILRSLETEPPGKIDQRHRLVQGTASLLEAAYIKAITLRTNKGHSSAYRHFRPSSRIQREKLAKGEFVLISPPEAAAEQQVANKLYRAIWHQHDVNPDIVKQWLGYFWRYHRTWAGHIRIKDITEGVSFIFWVMNLLPNTGITCRIAITPNIDSAVNIRDQKREWKQLLKPLGKRCLSPLMEPAAHTGSTPIGTAKVWFLTDTQGKKEKTGRQYGYPVRYALLMACIVKAVAIIDLPIQ